VLPRFRGEILQTPPMYSALKVDGQKLVDLARKGEVIEREAGKIEIFSLEATPTEDKSEYILDVHCSGGTYIRTLCADIGASLGCGGAMAALERGEACGFDLSQAHTTEELEAMSMEERLQLLIPTESLFANLPQIKLSAFFEKLSRSGCEIYLKKIGLDFPLGTRVSLCDANGAFFALGEVGEFRDGVAVKAIKMFVL
ncbi:MAG: pseudouridine synthase, partial [Clostridia bacterium]|nr:pseudouridine synthase [Clostridia bacterium]